MKQTYKKYCCMHFNLPYKTFRKIHILCTTLVFILLLFLPYGYIVSILGTIIFYYCFIFIFIDIPYKRKGKQLEKEAPLFFLVFLLYLDKSKNIKKSIEIACSLMDNMVTKEFQYVLKDSFVGQGFILRLEETYKNCASPYVKSIILSIIESAKRGELLIPIIKKELSVLIEKNEKERIREYNKTFYRMGIYTILITIVMFLVYFTFHAFL